jgi:hypothetical protein
MKKMKSDLSSVKNKEWFYEFNLPDGTKTKSYIPESVRKVHTTREEVLRDYLESLDQKYSSAFDIACHEGFFSLILSDYFDSVQGIDKNPESIEKSILISSVLGKKNVKFDNLSFETLDETKKADFVLCFGLLYHVENPLDILRKLSTITTKELCIETQVLPLDINFSMENGGYMWQREVTGMFGLCLDDPSNPEGRCTNLSVVPSRQAIEFLLKQFGFKDVVFYTPKTDDYEQFVRNHRVIIFAKK